MSSAIDVKEKERAKGKGKDKDAPKSLRPNPVPLEVPVSVTWAKPAKPDEKRDLYSEETVTALVFKDGAVIQLAAAISIGQLLFLTHKKTDREVVCQVVQKRTFRPTSCYVELEFTEPAEDFWGVTFPANEEDTKVPAIAEAVATLAPTEDAGPEVVTAPRSEDVAQLKDEIKALRKQLQELKRQPAEEKQTEEEKRAAEEREAAARRLEEAEEHQAQEAEAAAQREKEATARRLAEAETAARRAAEEEAEARKAAEAEAAEQREAEESHYAAQPLEEMEALAQRLAQAEAAARRAAEEEAAARNEAQANKSAERPAAGVEVEAQQATEVETEPQKDEEPSATEPTAETAVELKPSAEQPAPEIAPVRPKIGMKLPSLGTSVVTPVVPTEPPKPPTATTDATGAIPPHEDDGLDDLLPKPALDFSKAKVVDPNDPNNIYRLPPKPPGLQEKLVAAGLTVFLVVLVGVSWYNNWLPFLHHERKASATAKTAPSVTPSDIVKDTSGLNTANTANALNIAPKRNESVAPVDASAAPSRGPAPAEAVSKPKAKPSRETSPDEVIDPFGGTPEVKTEAHEAKAGAAKISKNRGKAETSAESKPKPVMDVVESNAPVIPAKLLKSVPPVYPPDAMRQYITGDVRIEAEVDEKGHIGAMNVLFGPAAFRQAAMDALQQYEYAPATQGGQPVASKVVVTVKFWFDP